MAGIFLWYKTETYDPKTVNNIFSSLGYKEGTLLDFNEWQVLVFPKSQYEIKNWLKNSDGIICGVGTFAYKGKVYNEALPYILADCRNAQLQLDQFWGNFLIFLRVGNRHILIRDGAALARLHGLTNYPVYSSSFAGLIRCSSKKLKLNEETVIELLATGLTSGIETLVTGIDLLNHSYSPKKLELIFTKPQSTVVPKNKNEALEQQVSLAKDFIKKVSDDWFNYMPESLFDVSLSGGMDSRFLTALIINQHQKLHLHTFWRDSNSHDPDFRIAQMVAEYLKMPISYKEVKSALELNEYELISRYKEAHDSCDGVIRPGTFWDEAFSTAKYRLSLAQIPYLRLSGFGGEQYRNMERLPLKSSRSFRSWITWEMIYRFAGHHFSDRYVMAELIERISTNLTKTLGNGTFNLPIFKEYQRKILVVSYRSFQTNMENRYGFLISPFSDTNLSIPAENAFPYLGDSLGFEIDMLKRVSLGLASLPSSYGFTFSAGEPLMQKLGVKLWQIVPPSVKMRSLNWYKNNYQDDFVSVMSKKSPFIKSLIDTVDSVNLPIDVKQMAKRRIRGKLVLNLGYFLKENERWLAW